MRLGRISFAPSLAGSVLALTVICVTVALGEWQSGRAREKIALQDQWNARANEEPTYLDISAKFLSDLNYKNVKIKGEFLPGHTFYIDNRVHKGRAGYHVISPFQPEGKSEFLLINRGWMLASPNRAQLPVSKSIGGKVELTGVVSYPAKGAYELGATSAQGPIRQHLAIEQIALELNVKLMPFVILQLNETADGLVRDWQRPDTGANTNLAYAFQWRAMALAAFLGWLYFSCRKTTDVN